MFTLKKTKFPVFQIKGGKQRNTKIFIDPDSKEGDKGCFKEIECLDGNFQLLPSQPHRQRDAIYITGPSGCGKSTFVGKFMKEYHKAHKDNNIVLFSPKDEEPAFDDKLDIIKISISENSLLDEDNKVQINELEDSLVIFDDIEAITDKRLREEVRNLRDCLLLVGRSKGISVLTTNHLVTDNRATKVPIVESQFFVCYPGGGGNMGIKRYLKQYCGMSNDEISDLLKINSRYICFHSHYPRFVLSKDYARVL